MSLALAGAGLRSFLVFWQKDWYLSWGSLAWVGGGIALEDIAFTDGKGLALHAPRLVISWRDRSLCFEKPHLILYSLPSFERSNAPSWALHCVDGVLEGEGFEPAHFSFSTITSPTHKAVASVHWDAFPSSRAEIRAEKNGDGTLQVDLDLAHFDLEQIRKFVPPEWSGSFSGRLQCLITKKSCRWSSGLLEATHVGFRDLFEGCSGTLQWQNPLQKDGFAKLALKEGALHLERSQISHIQGDAGFYPATGAKWNFFGVLDQETCRMQGKAFLQSLDAPWLESEVRSSSALVKLRGKQAGKTREWNLSFQSLDPQTALLFLDLAAWVWPTSAQWTLAEGTASGEIELFEKPDGSWEKKLLTFEGNHLCLESASASLRMDRLSWTEDSLRLEGGNMSWRFPNGQTIEATHWLGQRQGSLGHFSGSIGSLALDVQTEGSEDRFLARISMTAPCTGCVLLQGEREGSNLSWTFREGNLEGFQFAAQGNLDLNRFELSGSSSSFQGLIAPFCSMFPHLPHWQGMLAPLGEGLTFHGSLDAWEWTLDAQLKEGQMPLVSRANLTDVALELHASSQGIECRNARGVLSLGTQRIPLYAPRFQSDGPFDIRFCGMLADRSRLVGCWTKGQVTLDPSRSHLFGSSLTCETCQIKEGELLHLDLSVPLNPSLLAPWIRGLPLAGEASVRLTYQEDRGAELCIEGRDLTWHQEPLALSCFLRQEGTTLKLEPSRIADFTLEGSVLLSKDSIARGQGKIQWKEGFFLEWEGQGESFDKWDIRLSKVQIDFDPISPFTSFFELPLEKIQGKLEGSGIFHWEGHLEADLDFCASNLQVGSFLIENRAPLHFFYSSEMGCMFRGFDVAVFPSGCATPWFDCKIGLLQYQPFGSRWVLKRSQFYLPAHFLSMWKNPPAWANILPLSQELSILADVECSSDFSTFSFFVKEGLVPLGDQMYHVENLQFEARPDALSLTCALSVRSEPLRMKLDVDLYPPVLHGRWTIQDALFMDWTYQDRFSITAIEGHFEGSDICFHQAGDALIGSAHLDLTSLAPWLPPRLANVFRELKMGKGYELMGKLHASDAGARFQGILSGKQFEFFGYQLRTLLAQAEITPTSVRLYDIKIGDSALTMQIDEILAQAEGQKPWTLSLPRLTLTELRPSLLQRVGAPPSPMSPLVVRKLRIENLKGLLEESKTYTAKGELSFINSYKREYTLFDLPSDALSRIFGLDLELLIPVQGHIRFELKDGFFSLNELTGAYSEGKRSEFFLVKNEDSPKMELDGNLHILVQMKQFVLFKFTEAFIISVTGKLDEPEFHLHRKKSFLGL